MNPNALRLIAVVLLLGAVLLGWYGYRAGKPGVVTTVAPAAPATVPQLVAARNIEAGQTIFAGDVTITQVSHFNSAGFGSADAVLGRTAAREIARDAPLLAADLQTYGPAARQLQPGERAVAVKVDEVTGVGGYIRPGDHVDVLFFANDEASVRRSSLAQVVLSDLRVISFGDVISDDEQKSDADLAVPETGRVKIGDRPDVRQNASVRSAVLAVAEKDATTLMLAASIGQLRLALRGTSGDGGVVGVSPVATSPAESVRDRFVIKSDRLLSPEAAAPPPVRRGLVSNGVPRVVGRKPVTSEVIVHYGDTTRVVTVKETK